MILNLMMNKTMLMMIVMLVFCWPFVLLEVFLCLLLSLNYIGGVCSVFQDGDENDDDNDDDFCLYRRSFCFAPLY